MQNEMQQNSLASIVRSIALTAKFSRERSGRKRLRKRRMRRKGSHSRPSDARERPASLVIRAAAFGGQEVLRAAERPFGVAAENNAEREIHVSVQGFHVSERLPIRIIRGFAVTEMNAVGFLRKPLVKTAVIECKRRKRGANARLRIDAFRMQENAIHRADSHAMLEDFDKHRAIRTGAREPARRSIWSRGGRKEGIEESEDSPSKIEIRVRIHRRNSMPAFIASICTQSQISLK
jgi:hypothetical protein